MANAALENALQIQYTIIQNLTANKRSAKSSDLNYKKNDTKIERKLQRIICLRRNSNNEDTRKKNTGNE